ncbi:sema domain-containing protein [Phthorimaea operculella]|nr:sema domain-containing protein [Phthorimaea operculella]
MYKVAALILLATLSRGDLPEDDFRIITKQDLLATDSDIFEDNSAKSFSQLLFDVARDQVIVGARDALYRLSLRGLRQLERAEWPAPEDKAKLCQDKGQTEEDCHNYVKVLLSYGHKLFACGTNAFSPVCSWREIESISTVTDQVTGVANCPYNPHSNVTALLASSGEYYAGTPTDFAGSDTAICSPAGFQRGVLRGHAHRLRRLRHRHMQYDLNWLNEPQFVGSFEDDSFVYFVFREVAVEFMNCGKTIYSRIARVCKNDSGGHLPLDKWSTFLKARLTCSVPGEVPFYYDEVQSVAYLPQEKLIVATFSTPSNSVAGSAICVYNMSEVHAVFSGPYKTQETTDSVWKPRAPSAGARDHFRCVPDTRPFQQKEYNRYYLMHHPIQPISGEPVYKVDLQRFTHVTVDATPTETGRQLVAYVATLDDDIYKLAVLPGLDGACLVEVLKLKDDKGGFRVLNMQFVKDTMSLYIGSETGVVRVSGERCGRFKNRAACTAAGDPHCAWDDARETCLHDQDHLPAPATACRGHAAPGNSYPQRFKNRAACTAAGDPHCAWDDARETCLHDQDHLPAPATACRGHAAPDGPGERCGRFKNRAACTAAGDPHCAWDDARETCLHDQDHLPAPATACRGHAAPGNSSILGSRTARPAPRPATRTARGTTRGKPACTTRTICPRPPPPAGDTQRQVTPWFKNRAACTAAGDPHCAWDDARETCLHDQDHLPAPATACRGHAAPGNSLVQEPRGVHRGRGPALRNRAACTAAGDPHCAWDDARETCLHDQDHLPAPATACRGHAAPVDGGWSSWSEWAPCMQDGTAHSEYGERPDMCLCRTRRCDSPRPQHGGNQCAGASISVTNCTVHGGWSAWSGWSECSPSCGIAVKSRRRSCTAPEPKFGGRVCVGLESQDVFCSNSPPCPNPDLAPVDGGVDCDGSKLDRQVCDLRQCELRKATAWTPWVQISGNSSDDDSYTEKRFKFLCKAPSPEQLKLTMAREEERYCTSRGCSSAPPAVPNSGPDDGSWDPWAPWGPCSAPCGGGQQARTRRCRKPPCVGSKEMLRACNTHSCSGTWSCWSEWSACSGECSPGAVGSRTRTRMCLSPEGCADAGAALERRACIAPCDDNDAGWGAWGTWTSCDNGERLRRRSCANDACVGAQIQVARTASDDVDNELYAMPAYTSNLELASFVTVDGRDSLGAGGIFGCVFAAFVVGWLLCLATVVYCQRRGSRLPWSRTTRVPSSPHYITAKQNSYVTVPLKDVVSFLFQTRVPSSPHYITAKQNSYVTVPLKDVVSFLFQTRVPSSPHYITAKQNSYVTVPLKDVVSFLFQTRVPSSPHYITAKQNSYVTVPLKDVVSFLFQTRVPSSPHYITAKQNSYVTVPLKDVVSFLFQTRVPSSPHYITAKQNSYVTVPLKDVVSFLFQTRVPSSPHYITAKQNSYVTVPLKDVVSFLFQTRVPSSPHYITAKQNSYVTVPLKDVVSFLFQTRVPSSPHYITAKQNSYVTVPLKDVVSFLYQTRVPCSPHYITAKQNSYVTVPLKDVVSFLFQTRVPSSPHYITAKQNSYVTVPLKDVVSFLFQTRVPSSSPHYITAKQNSYVTVPLKDVVSFLFQTRVPSSPHYITAKQNSYVTVPLKDVVSFLFQTRVPSSSPHYITAKQNSYVTVPLKDVVSLLFQTRVPSSSPHYITAKQDSYVTVPLKDVVSFLFQTRVPSSSPHYITAKQDSYVTVPLKDVVSFLFQTRVPSSPHYITAKQNSYVTVRLKDVILQTLDDHVPAEAARRAEQLLLRSLYRISYCLDEMLVMYIKYSRPSMTMCQQKQTIMLSKSDNIKANNHNTAATPKLYPKAIANEYDSSDNINANNHNTAATPKLYPKAIANEYDSSDNIKANNHNTAATPKLYPKAIANEYDSVGTLRRHSNQPNNKNNLDVEEDKFY